MSSLGKLSILLRWQHIFRKLFVVTLVLIAGLISYFLNVSMVAFQKSAMITAVDTLPIEIFQHSLDRELSSPPDVRKLIAPIPYQNGQAIYDIFPKARFHKTIEMGYGNCSNLAFGMAFLLLRDKHAFQIVHLLPYDGFLGGVGHTVLSMPYELDGAPHTALVDLLEGGVPQEEGKFIDVLRLQQKHLAGASILPLSTRKDTESIYYGDFLNRAAVGIVPSNEVKKYFDFVELIYVPLGSKRLERIIYSGFAVVLGQFPHTYVSREEYTRLFSGNMHLVWAANALIWLLRLMPLMLITLIISFLCNKKGSRTASKRLSIGSVSKSFNVRL